MPVLRLAALAAILSSSALSAAIDFAYPGWEDLTTTLMTPGTPLWGAMQLALAASALYALHPSQRRVGVHDRIAWLLIAVSLSGMISLSALRLGFPGLSVVMSALQLVAGVGLFRLGLRLSPRLAAFPFTFSLGWMTMATLAGVFSWVAARGWRGAFPGEPFYAALMLLFAGWLGIALSRRYGSSIYPLVLAFVAFDLALTHGHASYSLHATALGVGVTLVSWVAAAETARRLRGRPVLC